MRVLVIANPRATATTARQRDVVARALSADAKLEVEETAHRGHAAALACRAMRDGVDVVVALGGDGTVNEVVNGLLTDGVHDQVPALGVVPGGSTNVFARALGLPNDPIEATGVLIDALNTGRRRPIGLGRADSRWFVFAAGLGYDAAVVRDVESHRRRGRTSTHTLYVRTALRTFLSQDRRHPSITLTSSDGRTFDELFMALVTNCDPWTFVGNRAISPTPQASFDTGLDVYARTRMGALGVLWSTGRMLRRDPGLPVRGLRARLPNRLGGLSPDEPSRPLRRRDTRERRLGARVEHDLDGFVLSATQPQPFQVDGDLLGDRESVRFIGVPEALQVCI